MSPLVRKLLLDCLAKDPAARPQSMKDVTARLAQVCPSNEIHLQTAVVIDARRQSGGASDGRASGARSGQRLAQTTPMPASGSISSSGSTLAAPLEDAVMPLRPASSGHSRPLVSPAAITTPSVGRTRVLLPDDPSRPADPSTLNDGAVERYKTTPRRRGAGSKIAIGVAAVAAVALAAMVIVRALTAQPSGGTDKDTTAQNDSPGNGTTSTTGAATGETEHTQVTKTPPPPPQPAISVITLLGLPAEALVRLDGRAVTSPVSVPREAETHRLIVDANGYQRWETSFDARTDHTVAVEMRRLATPPAARPTPARPHKHGGDRTPHDAPGFDGFTDL